jgi:chaperonin cofactor prefoldin
LFLIVSASYAGLEKWELAVADAKECIRLDPSFIKGYYRLANAQMSQSKYDSAIQTIRQGLLLENNNSQLMKQLRLAQQQKKVVTAKQQSLATASQQQQQPASILPNTDGVMTTLDPATASEYQELQSQYSLVSREYNTLQADVIKSQRESKVADITCQELEKVNNDTTACYRSIGKLFVKSSKVEMTEQLQQRQMIEEKNMNDNTKKLEYMERQLTSIRQNMNEIIQKSQ